MQSNCNIINTHAEKTFTIKLKCSRFNIVLQGIKHLISNSQKAKKDVQAMSHMTIYLLGRRHECTLDAMSSWFSESIFILLTPRQMNWNSWS